MLRNGLTGFIVHFQRADDPLAIVNPLSGLRIDGLQKRYHGIHTLTVRLRFQLFPHSGGREGGKGVAFDQAVHIKTGAAGDDGGLAPGEDVL